MITKPIYDGERLERTISLRFSDKELEEIEKIAKKMGLPKTRLMRNLILTFLEDAKNNVNILKGAVRVKEFKEKLKKSNYVFQKSNLVF